MWRRSPRRLTAAGRWGSATITPPMARICLPMPKPRAATMVFEDISRNSFCLMSIRANAYTETELMIALLSREVMGLGHVVVGALSPLPAAAALLAQASGPTRATILGSKRYNSFTEGARELFDCAAQGRIDAFFLSGG